MTVATAALGRILTMASIMGLMLKSERDRVSVTIKGSGPLGSLIVVGRPDGSVKGFVDHPQVHLPSNKGKLDVGGGVGLPGFLTVSKDLGLREPYVGRIPLVSGEIAEDFVHYFLASEQTPSLVALGVLVDTDASVRAAGGVLLQPMPGCSEEMLSALELRSPLLGMLSTLYDEGRDARQLLDDLFDGIDISVLEETTPRFQCDCSRERLEGVFIAMGREDIEHLMEKNEPVEAVCHFCGSSYTFSVENMGRLLEEVSK